MNVPYSGMERAFKPIWKVLECQPHLLESNLNRLTDDGYEIVNIHYLNISTHSYHSYSNHTGSGEFERTNSDHSNVITAQVVARKWEVRDL